MTETKFTTIYDDWSAGSWGAKGSRTAAAANPKPYRSINLQVYSNGSLGPRPGWKQIATTGTAPAPASGIAHGLTRWIPYAGTTYGYLFFGCGSTSAQTKRLPLDTLVWATSTAGTMNFAIDDGLQEMNPVSICWLNTKQAIIGGQLIYDIGANTTISITYPSSFVPTHAVFYRTRLYAWGDPTFPNRVYYSDDGAFSTFTAGSFFDVGSGGTTAPTRPRIHGMYPLRDGILIYANEFAFSSTNQRNVEGDWFVLQGANPITGSLRALGRNKVPSGPSIAGIYGTNLVGMDFDTGRGMFMHNGTDLDNKSLAYLRPGYELVSRAGSRSPVAMYGEPTFVMPYLINYSDSVDPTRSGTDPIGYMQEDGMQALALVHGVWNKELWWNGAIDKTITSVSPFVWGISPFQADKLIATTNASADGLTGTWRVVTRDVCLDRPAKTDDTWSDPTETHSDTTGTGTPTNQLWLPSEQAPLGHGARVLRVTVDFDYWKESTFSPASTADMTCKVRYQGLANNRAATSEVLPQTGTAGVFDYLPATTGRTSKRGRYTFFFPEAAFFGEYQVIFPTIRNMAIHTVTVDGEHQVEATYD